MKKLSLFVVCGLLAAVTAFAQEWPTLVVVADWETSPGALNSSPDDQISYTRNPFPGGINESKGVGKYTHKNEKWTTGEIQAGRLRTAAGIKPELPAFPDNRKVIHLGYYDRFEFKWYFPAEAVADGLSTNMGVALCSDGPDRGTDSNVERENGERQYITYPQLPLNTDGSDMVDTWFKVERSGIVSGRELEMIQFKFRAGEKAPSATASTIYLDDVVFHLKNSQQICTYMESFFFFGKDNVSWSGDPNQTVTMYPGQTWEVKMQTGAARWVGGAEIQATSVSFPFEGGGRGHYLELEKSSPEVQIVGIDILPGLEDLQLELEVMNRAPGIEYRLDGGDWKAVDFSTSSTVVGPNWNKFTFPISANSVSKVDLKISGAGIANGKGYIDNIVIWGRDKDFVPGPGPGPGNAVLNVNASAGVRLYPNPAVNTLFVDGDVKQVNLYDMKGQLALTATGSEINVSGLATGMYIVKLHTAEGILLSKVFKK